MTTPSTEQAAPAVVAAREALASGNATVKDLDRRRGALVEKRSEAVERQRSLALKAVTGNAGANRAAEAARDDEAVRICVRRKCVPSDKKSPPFALSHSDTGLLVDLGVRVMRTVATD